MHFGRGSGRIGNRFLPTATNMPELSLTRTQFLAAEVFSYSFANYRDHLGIGHVRFDQLMPEKALMLERAVAENWTITQVARAMEVDTDAAAAWIEGTRKALRIVDANNAADAFREAVRQVVETAVSEGFDDDSSIASLVTQICYRASDFACLLEAEGKTLSEYSEELWQEPDCDELDFDAT